MDFFILSRELGVRGRTQRAPPASRRDGVGVVHPERMRTRRPPRRGGRVGGRGRVALSLLCGLR